MVTVGLQTGQNPSQPVDGGVDLGLRHQQRRGEPQHVGPGGVDHQTGLEGLPAGRPPPTRRSRTAASSSPSPRTLTTPGSFSSPARPVGLRTYVPGPGRPPPPSPPGWPGPPTWPGADPRRCCRGHRARRPPPPRPGPSRPRPASRCRGPWPWSRCRAPPRGAGNRTTGRYGPGRSAPRPRSTAGSGRCTAGGGRPGSPRRAPPPRPRP